MRARALLSCAVAVALVATAPAAHAEVVLAQGYVDIIDVQYNGGHLEVYVEDHTVHPPLTRNPANIVFQVKPSARTSVPADPQYAFLGPPGSPVWILPQTQRSDLLWPALRTTALRPDVFVGNRVDVRLTAVAGPGDFSVYQASAFGAPTKWFDSGDGLPDVRSTQVGQQYIHAAWAFEAIGEYALTFEVTAVRAADGVRLSSGPIRYSFVVGGL